MSRDDDLALATRALQRLRIGSGGRMSHVRLDPPHDRWALTLCEPPRISADGAPFAVLTLHAPNGRESRRELQRESLHTRGRSPWRRSNAWRLTDATIEIFASSMAEILARPEASK